jgi:hypothetical protein
MALDDHQVRRTTDAALRHLDRMQNELRQLANEVDRLGQAFRNDRRFSGDAFRLRDEMKAVDRELARTRDRVRNIQRNAR